MALGLPAPASENRVTTQTLNQLRLAAAQARLPYERDWWLNTAFFLDEQYVEWSPEINNLRRIPRTRKTQNMPRPVVNKINHFVNQQMAFALEDRPVPDVLPPTDSDIDMSDSQVALAYCNWVASPHVAGHDQRIASATLWALITGEAYLKWCWDPKLKRPAVLVCSPFDTYLDPYAEEWDHVRYIIHSRFMDKEQVYDSYGKEVKAAATQQDPTRAKLLREMGNAPVLEGVTVNEIWMKPNRRHKGGLYCIWTGDQILFGPEPIPYEEARKARKLPFTQIGVLPRPGSIHYDSHIKYLRKPQMELNKYHAQRIQIRENFANPKWWAPTDLELEELPDNSPNQVLRGHGEGGLEPKIIQAAAMADNNEGEWIRGEMMDTVGLHEVSQGQVPGRVESSKAIELLKEADASRLKTLIDTVHAAIEEGYWHIIVLAKQYESAEKIVQTYSPEGIAEVKAFKSRKVHPGTRFVVRSTTGLAWSRAARTDQLLRLWEVSAGQLFQGPDHFLQLLDIASPLVLSANAADVRLARNENLTMAGGKAIMPNSWDNHEIHLREHNNYRKTHEFLLLSADAKQRFEMHCEKHEELLLTELKKMAERQMVAQPMPPEQTGAESSGQTGPGQTPEEAPA